MPKKRKLSECKSKEQADSDFFASCILLVFNRTTSFRSVKLKALPQKNSIWLQNIKDRRLKESLDSPYRKANACSCISESLDNIGLEFDGSTDRGADLC